MPKRVRENRDVGAPRKTTVTYLFSVSEETRHLWKEAPEVHDPDAHTLGPISGHRLSSTVAMEVQQRFDNDSIRRIQE